MSSFLNNLWTEQDLRGHPRPHRDATRCRRMDSFTAFKQAISHPETNAWETAQARDPRQNTAPTGPLQQGRGNEGAAPGGRTGAGPCPGLWFLFVPPCFPRLPHTALPSQKRSHRGGSWSPRFVPSPGWSPSTRSLSPGGHSGEAWLAAHAGAGPPVFSRPGQHSDPEGAASLSPAGKGRALL